MSRTEPERLRDIKDAIQAIHGHVDRLGSEANKEDTALLHDALLFQFVVVGEAVKNLSRKTRERQSDIPWEDIAGLRDLIAHEYFHIEIDRVLEIVNRDLPALEAAIDRLLNE